MAERRVFIDRVKGAERECSVIVASVAHFEREVRMGHIDPAPGTTLRDLVAARLEVEPTYIVRMWAEFESGVRSYWRQRTNAIDSAIGTKSLIEWTAGIKQGRPIASGVREDVQEVREYRNFLVHQRDSELEPVPIPIQMARRRLNLFLGCLPESW